MSKRAEGIREKVENTMSLCQCQMIFFYSRDKSLRSTYMPMHTPAAVGPH